MILASENVVNRRQMYIIISMNEPKQSQLVEKIEKLLLCCAQVTKWCGGRTSIFENVISDLRNAPKPLIKSVNMYSTCKYLKKMYTVYCMCVCIYTQYTHIHIICIIYLNIFNI